MSADEPATLGDLLDLPSPTATFRVLETFDRAASGVWEPLREDIRRRVGQALEDFPELAGYAVTVGRLNPETDSAAQAFSYNHIVTFPTDRRTPWQDIYHELSHLAIYELDRDGRDVPTSSEEFCSIFAVARMPQHRAGDRDDIAYLGEPAEPSERWPDICQRALDYRADRGAGSHYIKRCKEWLGVGP